MTAPPSPAPVFESEPAEVVTINELLRLDARITLSGRELKGVTPYGEVGAVKTYWDANECQRLADAFGRLALRLAREVGQ